MKKQKNKPKICLLYDDLYQKGGGEKLFLYLVSIYPQAVIYVPVISKYYRDLLNTRELHYSKFLSSLLKFPKIGYPLASFLSIFYFEKLNLNKFDYCVSLTNRFSHCVITSTSTKHLVIVTTPFRALFTPNRNYILSNIFNYFRIYLQSSFKRPDRVVAISSVSQKKLQKYTSTPSLVLNPPLLLEKDITKFTHLNIRFEKDDYVLIVGRIVGSKLKYFDELLGSLGGLEILEKSKVVFVGGGDKLNYLKNKYKKVIFTGYLEQSKLNYLYKNAKVLIHPQIEDYGLIPLEAMYFNTPIICKKAGGVLDYLTDDSVLFYKSKKKLLENLKSVLQDNYKINQVTRKKILEIAKAENFEYNLKNIVKNI